MTFRRYAVYFGPRQQEALYGFGLDWLGTDPQTGLETSVRPLAGFSMDEHQALIAAPRRYALHGTLKPPFRLAEGHTYEELRESVGVLAAKHGPATLPTPNLTQLSGFLALCPATPATGLDQLAAACVTELDKFRAQPSAAELAQRRSAGLTARQERNLVEWGYPYVLEDFRFHVTLTGRLDAPLARRVEPALRNRLLPVLEQPLQIQDLCIYGEPENGQPFRIVDRIALQSTD